EVEQRLLEECEDACVEGVCVDIVCFSDEDCIDGNPDTVDLCFNPGTTDSFCFHGEIMCSSDVDCGVDQFIGDLI
ncbi:MAG: hypothetical protein AABX90_03175, partial [Nanoarchaeota archaeon]